jgi:beta-lactamase superfamily II metal-dependent hydrolase
MKIIIRLTFILLVAITLFGCKKNNYTLWQLDSITPNQANLFVMRTPNNKTIVIDGGYKQDAPYMKGFLAALGNHVDMWIISHPHHDHVNAITEILKQPDGLTIDQIWGSFPTVEWTKKHEEWVVKDIVEFQDAMNQANKEFLQVKLGDIFEIDNITIEVLGIINPEFTNNAINNSSMVFKMYLPNTSLLFLGDLGHEGGEKLLAGEFSSKLPSDYVQMAHHGQQGVSEAVYQAINPKYCLWPTPDWLWDNDKGEGKNSGPWKTLEVREWMDKLDVQKHYVMKDGMHKIMLR